MFVYGPKKIKCIIIIPRIGISKSGIGRRQVIVHFAHIIMQRQINQGGVVRKELWTTKRDDMGPLKRQHGHIYSSTRRNDDHPGYQGKVIIGHLATFTPIS